MKAELIFRRKEASDGFIREMVVWRLSQPVSGCQHLFKYRFYFGTDDGTCLVRYDNERGKGDHKHLAGMEYRYLFKTLESAFADFLSDIHAVLQKREVKL